MTKRQIEHESWDFSYNGNDENHDAVRRFTLQFDNPEGDEEVVEQLNTFLQAVGRRNITVRSLDRG